MNPQKITYSVDGITYQGEYDLENDACTIEPELDLNQKFDQICLPTSPFSARRYGYSHGSPRYRALVDAIRKRHDDEEIFSALTRLYDSEG